LVHADVAGEPAREGTRQVHAVELENEQAEEQKRKDRGVDPALC